MRVLYLAHRVPDRPTKGDKIRSWRQLQALAARHEVHVFALDDEPEGLPEPPPWRERVADLQVVPLGSVGARLRAARAAVTGGSLSAAWFAAPALRRRLAATLARVSFDVTVVYSGAMDPLVHGLRPRVLDLVDVDSAKFRAYHRQRTVTGLRRLAFGLEGRRLAALERRAVADADVTLVCTEAEADVLRETATPRRLEVLRNGVDLEAFPFAGPEGRAVAELVFVGALDYEANVDAVRHLVRDLLPGIRAAVPAVRLTVVGRSPTPAVRALADALGVEVVADADSVVPFLHRATATLIPLRIARGIQNKALEALATGVPAVLSPQAASGLDARAGQHHEVGRSCRELVEQTVTLLESPQRRSALALAGRRLVEERYDWEGVQERFVGLVEEVATAPEANAESRR